MDAQQAIELLEIEERLIAEFHDALEPEEIRRYLEQIVESFDEASVRTYVMLFIERRARANLRVAARSKYLRYETAEP
jgi:hypothetical protein